MTGKRNSIKRYELKTNKAARLTTKEKARLDVMTDVDIDYSDIADMSVELEKLYRPLKKTITIRLDEGTIDYFKRLAEETELPYQSLINLYLRDCAASGRRLSMTWKGSKVGAA